MGRKKACFGREDYVCLTKDCPYMNDCIQAVWEKEDEKNEEVPITILLKEVSRQKTLSEEKRVFYVGATRARDVLVLSGDPLLRGASPSRLGWLMDALEMQRNVPQAALELSTSVTVLSSPPAAPDGAR